MRKKHIIVNFSFPHIQSQSEFGESFNVLPVCVWQTVCSCCFNLHFPNCYWSCAWACTLFFFLYFFGYICLPLRSSLQWIKGRLDLFCLFLLFATWYLKALEASVITPAQCPPRGRHLASWIVTLPVTLSLGAGDLICSLCLTCVLAWLLARRVRTEDHFASVLSGLGCDDLLLLLPPSCLCSLGPVLLFGPCIADVCLCISVHSGEHT